MSAPRRTALPASWAIPAYCAPYGAGETVKVEVRVDRVLSGIVRSPSGAAPRVALTFGRGTHAATRYAEAVDLTNLAGGAVIWFDYEVVRGDRDPDGIAIGANAIEMNGGGFRDRGGNLIAPALAHPAVAADPGHKVDGGPVLAVPLAPDLTGVTVSVSGRTLGFRLDRSQAPDPAREPVTGYRVECSDDASTGWTAITPNLGAPATPGTTRVAFSEENVPPGTTRHYRVFALSLAGDSPASATVSGTVPAADGSEDPDQVTGVSVADARAREGEPVTFTVTLAGAAPSGALELAATPSSGPGDTATAGTDFATAVQNLRIPAGQTSATFSVATTQDRDVEPDETFTVTLSARPGTTLPDGVTIGDRAATGTILDDDGEIDDEEEEEAATARHLPWFAPASDPLGRRSFARIVNESGVAGEVRIDAFDDAGERYGPLTLALGANETVHLSSGDLESGNAGKGLDGATGAGEGRWRLAFTSDLDLLVPGYLRTEDGFVTSVHDLVPRTGAGHHVVFFNPGGNPSQVSRLRLVNRGAEDAEVTIEGIDDDGESPGSAVRLTVPARGARTVTARELESGDARGESARDLDGALGDGAGKWRLVVTADRDIDVMSLLASPTGHLTNLSTVPGGTSAGDGEVVHHLPWFAPASDPLGRQSFARIVNESDVAGEVRIDAFDDAGERYGPLTLALGANETVHLNSEDLESGNAGKGLDGATGAGEGRWRLAFTSDLDLVVPGYLRTEDGFVTSVHDLVPRTGAGHHVVFFNPGGNPSQVSRLRLVNRGAEDAEVTIEGIDDAGESPGTAVRLTVPARGARTVTARELESEDARGESARDLDGALGDGAGKWRLVVTADRDIDVMSLLASPTGHLTNLSTVPGASAP